MIKIPAILAASAGTAALAQCPPQWSLLPVIDEFACCVNALAVFDAGAGPSLYAAGQFETANGVPVHNIARWDGQAWVPVGGGVEQGLAETVVYAMAVFDPDGPGPLPQELIVSGNFSLAGGQPAVRIARWNGQAWSTLGAGTPDFYPHALTLWDADGAGPQPALLLAGGGRSTGGVRRIDTWNGSAWTAAIPDLPAGTIEALCVHDEDGPGPSQPTIFAGGRGVGGSTGSPLARLDTTGWTAIPGFAVINYPPEVSALLPFDFDGPGPLAPALFVGGLIQGPNFSFGAAVKWDGQALTPVGNYAGSSHDYILMAGTFDFDGPGPLPASLVADGSLEFLTGGGSAPPPFKRWDGASWVSTGYPVSYHIVPTSMAVLDEDGAGPMSPTLFVGNGDWSGATVARYGCNSPCYPNCDLSVVPPVLNIQDFACFLNRFANGDLYANCDGSTAQPILNVQDFACFLNRFAGGCS